MAPQIIVNDLSDSLERLAAAGAIEMMVHERDCTRTLLREPRRCAACNGMHVFFVNRDSRTRCTECDEICLSKASSGVKD